MAKESLSRRKFLKLAAGMGGAAVLGACAAPASAPAVAQPAATTAPAQPAATTAPAAENTAAVAAAPSGAQPYTLTVAHAWEAAFMPTRKTGTRP